MGERVKLATAMGACQLLRHSMWFFEYFVLVCIKRNAVYETEKTRGPCFMYGAAFRGARSMHEKGVAYPCAGMLTDLQFRSSPFPSEVELQIFFYCGTKKIKSI